MFHNYTNFISSHMYLPVAFVALFVIGVVIYKRYWA